MARRVIISKSTINRLVAASNRRKKEKYNASIIESQGGNEKERPPHYELTNVEFNEQTRVTRIEILQTQAYRTIQRYITQNYVKYPVFSEWKTKEKTIKKTLKLTNVELERLNLHEDELVRMFAYEIIAELDNTDLYPSWFIKTSLTKELEENIKEIDDSVKRFKNERKLDIVACSKIIEESTQEITMLNKLLTKLTKKSEKKKKQLEKILNATPNIIKTIFTLGIYNYLISMGREERLHDKLFALESDIKNINFKISSKNITINTAKTDIDKHKENINKNYEDAKKKKEKLMEEFDNKISQIDPLSNIIESNDAFVKLKLFSGMEYQKITGCYIIHNREKDKYYVGQSKDVYKRLKQHFKGTVPNNPIFAEDYYTSKYENKDELFEVKIIKCGTKDELDRTEKQLIYEYDSWNNGYNSTSGNI